MSLHEHIKEENFNNIDRYLNDEMTADEKSSFEIELNNNSELHDSFVEIKELQSGVERASLKMKLDGFHSEIPTQNQPDLAVTTLPTSNKTAWYAIAAVLVVALGMLWIFSAESTNQKLFAKHFVPDPGLPTMMGASENFLFNEAMVDYKLGNYTSAIEKWKKQLVEKPNNDTLNYFIGVATLANNNSENAVEYLQKSLTSKESPFKDDTNFYLGLAFLKDGNMEASKKALRKSNLPEAKKILEDLKP